MRSSPLMRGSHEIASSQRRGLVSRRIDNARVDPTDHLYEGEEMWFLGYGIQFPVVHAEPVGAIFLAHHDYRA